MTPAQALKRYKKAPKGFRNRALVRLQDVNLAELQRRTKYGNVKCEWQGQKFDSKRELERHLVLLDMQKRHEIKDLKRQVTFHLVVNGHKIGSVRPDWTYIEMTHDMDVMRMVAEDAKGFQTADHKTRWKLAAALFDTIDWRLS